MPINWLPWHVFVLLSVFGLPRNLQTILAKSLPLVNLTRSERLNRPASQMVARLHRYYADLAGREFERSGSPASNQWAVDYGILQVKPQEAASGARKLLEHLR